MIAVFSGLVFVLGVVVGDLIATYKMRGVLHSQRRALVKVLTDSYCLPFDPSNPGIGQVVVSTTVLEAWANGA